MTDPSVTARRPDPDSPALDPDLLHRLATAVDGRLGEMYALAGRSGHPIRGRKARQLLTVTRLLAGTVAKFEAEVALAVPS